MSDVDRRRYRYFTTHPPVIGPMDHPPDGKRPWLCDASDVRFEAAKGTYHYESAVRELVTALRSYVGVSRCENPTRKPLPNPMGYAEHVEIVPCGGCRWCKGYALITELEPPVDNTDGG